MNIDLDMLNQIPKIETRNTFKEAIEKIGYKFDYNQEQFLTDKEYANEITCTYIEKIIESENDTFKINLLYALRLNYEDYVEVDNSQIMLLTKKLIASIDDKKTLVDFTNAFSHTAYFDAFSKLIYHTLLDDEFMKKPLEKQEVNVMIEDIKSNKIKFVEREKNKVNDDKIIKKLVELKNKNYEDTPSWKIAKLIAQLSSDEQKLHYAKQYYKELVLLRRDGREEVLTLQNEVEGVKSLILSMQEDKNKTEIINEFFYNTLDNFSQNEKLTSNLKYQKALKYYEIFFLDEAKKDISGELAKLKEDGTYDEFLRFEDAIYKTQYRKYSETNISFYIDKAKKFDKNEEKIKCIKFGDLSKAIKAHGRFESLDVKNRILFGRGSDFVINR